MKTRRFLLLFLLSSCILVTAGCAAHTDPYKNYFSFREATSRAELDGTVGGIRFGAEIGTAQDGVYITFFRPDALAGITLRNRGGEIEFLADGKEIRTEGDALTGLISPLEILFSESSVLRIQKNGKETALTLPKEGTLTLNAEGIPISFTSPALCFTVVWWEPSPKGA